MTKKKATYEELEKRVREQEPWAVKGWEEKVGTPTTKSEKVLALDAAIHLAHFDPDMLRALPRHKRAWIITQDSKKEVAFVQECTKLALETDNLEQNTDFDSEDSSFEF